MLIRACSIGLTLICWIASAGCGDSDGLNLAPVRGTVTFDGKPAKGGFVLFEPVGTGSHSGPSAMGKINDDGSFVLTTKQASDGATIGENRVAIAIIDTDKPIEEASEKDAPQSRADVLRNVRSTPRDANVWRDFAGRLYRVLTPKKLKDPAQSGISVSVQPGSNVFEFTIGPDGSVQIEG